MKFRLDYTLGKGVLGGIGLNPNIKNKFKRKEKVEITEETTNELQKVLDLMEAEGKTFDEAAKKINVTNEAILKYGKDTEVSRMSAEHFEMTIKAQNQSLGMTGVMSKIAAGGVKLLNIAFSTLLTAGITIGVSLLVDWLIKTIDKIHETKAEIHEAAEQARTDIDNIKSDFKDLITTVDDVKERFAELSQGVNQNTGVNLKLSNDDYKEFLDISNQLADLFPNLNRTYDENGNAILDLNGDVNTIVTSLNDLIEAEQKVANQKLLEKMPDVYKEFARNVKDYQKEVEEYQELQEMLKNGISTVGYDNVNGLPNYGFQYDISNLNQDQDVRLFGDIQTKIKESGLDSYITSDMDSLYVWNADGSDELTQLRNLINEEIEDLARDIKTGRNKIQAEMYGFSDDLLNWLSFDEDFTSQSKEMQKAIQEFLFNNQEWIQQAAEDNISIKEWSDDLAAWLKENYIKALTEIDDEEIQEKIIKLFSVDTSPEDMVNIANYLQSYFDEHEIKIKLNFITDPNDNNSEANLLQRIQNRIDETVSDKNNLANMKRTYEQRRAMRIQQYSGSNYVGNVDINNRPVIDNGNGTYMTSYTGMQEYWKGGEDDGGYEIIHFTPILPDGTVLDDNTLYNYLDNTIAKADNALEADKTENGGLGIIYKVDTQVDGNKIDDSNLNYAFEVGNQFDIDMHNQQDSMYKSEAEALMAYNAELQKRRDLEQFFKDHSIDSREEYEEWLKVTEGIKDANAQMDAWNNRQLIDENGFFTETALDSIDKYKDKLSDLSGYLEKAKNDELTNEDKFNLVSTYGIAADSVEGYTTAIEKAMNSEVQNAEVLHDLKNAIETCDDEVKRNNLQVAYDALVDMNVELQNGSNKVNDYATALSSLQSSAQLLRDVEESKNKIGYIDSSKFDDILAQYPQMEKEIQKYNAGMIDSEQLFEELQECYRIDENNYRNLITTELNLDNEFYNNVKNKLPQWVVDQAKAYEIDFGNYKNLSEAKLGVDQKLMKKKVLLAKMALLPDDLQVDDEDNYRLQQVNDLQKILDELNKFNPKIDIDTSYELFGKDSSSNESDKFNESIDWISNSLTNLQDNVNDAQTALDNTKGFDNQIEAIKTLNTELEKLKTGYETASTYYSDKFENEDYNTLVGLVGKKQADKYYKNIKSGKKITLETIKSSNSLSDEDAKKVYDAVNNSMSHYQKSEEYRDSASETGYKIESNKGTSKQKEIDKLNGELSTINEQLNDQTLSAEAKNALLDDQLDKQKEINNKLIEQAQLEGNLAEVNRINAQQKNQERENAVAQLNNTKEEANEYASYFKTALENPSLSEEERKTFQNKLNEELLQGLQLDLKIGIQDIDQDALKKSIDKIRKKYGVSKKKMNDEKFLDKYMEDILTDLDDARLLDLFQKIVNETDNQKSTPYDLAKQSSDILLSKNNNNIADINNLIEANNGFGTEEQYKTLQGLHESSKQAWESQKKAAETMRKNYKEGEEGWQEWDDVIQDCENNISDCESKIKDCKYSILSLPLNDIQKKLTEINVELSELNYDLSKHNTLIDAAVGILDREIDNQNKLKENIQDQVDALQEEKSIRDDNLALSKAQYNLEKLKNQKTVKVFKNGGWSYEADEDALRSAQEEYDNALFNHKIETLNQQMKLYDDEIERLTKIKERWSKITQEAQLQEKINEAIAYDGNFYSNVLSGNLYTITQITLEYDSLYSKQQKLIMQQEKYQLLQELMNSTLELLQNNVIGEEEAKQRILDYIETYYPEIKSQYDKIYGSVDHFLDQKIQEKKDVNETSESNAKVIDDSNQAIAKSYEELGIALDKNFDQMKHLLDEFAKTAQSMAASVKTAVSEANLALLNLNKGKVTGMDVLLAGVGVGIGSFTKHHDGMEGGYIGSHTSETNDKKLFEKLALQPLKPDEYPAILQAGEAIINSSQRQNLLNNFYKAATLPTFKPTSTSQSIAFNGDIVVQGVQDVNGLAQSIRTQLPSKMIQELYKK